MNGMELTISTSVVPWMLPFYFIPGGLVIFIKGMQNGKPSEIFGGLGIMAFGILMLVA